MTHVACKRIQNESTEIYCEAFSAEVILKRFRLIVEEIGQAVQISEARFRNFFPCKPQ
jgi:hypothetical protein